MKFYLYVGLLLLLVIHWVSATDPTPVNNKTAIDNRVAMLKIIGRKLKTWWSTFIIQNENKDTFTGRCIGVAKKIKQLLPFLVFKLGVIMTLLTFLTLFSLKSLGLLGLLLLINTSSAVAKVTAALSIKKEDHDKKQNIHLHIHNSKNGYHLEGSSYGWEDRIDRRDSYAEEDSQSFNLYDKLLRNPYLRSFQAIPPRGSSYGWIDRIDMRNSYAEKDSQSFNLYDTDYSEIHI